MARKAKSNKEAKIKSLVDQYRDKRDHFRKIVKSSTDMDQVREAQDALSKLPLNSNPVRLTTRCQQCGRTHAVYRKFGLCRICLRQQLMAGNVAGGRKSSW